MPTSLQQGLGRPKDERLTDAQAKMLRTWCEKRLTEKRITRTQFVKSLPSRVSSRVLRDRSKRWIDGYLSPNQDLPRQVAEEILVRFRLLGVRVPANLWEFVARDRHSPLLYVYPHESKFAAKVIMAELASASGLGAGMSARLEGRLARILGEFEKLNETWMGKQMAGFLNTFGSLDRSRLALADIRKGVSTIGADGRKFPKGAFGIRSVGATVEARVIERHPGKQRQL